MRVFWGVSMSAVTSVRSVADCIAGQKSGSRRSRRSYKKERSQLASWGFRNLTLVVGWLVKMRLTDIHVHLPGEQRLARRVEEQSPLDQVQRAQDQQVVLSVAAPSHQSIERVDEPQVDVPLEALLQLEELVEGRVVREFGERLRT